MLFAKFELIREEIDALSWLLIAGVGAFATIIGFAFFAWSSWYSSKKQQPPDNE